MKVSLIEDNPLRVLGVFANATQREIEKNKAQLRAFARVGQKVQLPLWLNGLGLLPPLTNVTEERLAQAQAQLSLQKERDHHALFWFEQDKNHVRDEDKAIGLLNSNRVDEARQLWEQRTDCAAQKNLLLLAVLDDDWNKIAAYATRLFMDDTASFRTFLGEVLKLSPEADGLRSYKLLSHFTEESRRVEMKQMLVRKHQHTLDEAIDRLKRMKSEDIHTIKEELERMIAARSHVKALRYLLGDDSFTCSYYANQTAKALVNALNWYIEQDIFFLEYKWAAKIVNEIWADIDLSDPETKDLWRKKFSIDARAEIPQTIDSGKKDGGQDLIAYILGYIMIIVLLGLFTKACGGPKHYNPYKYNYLKYYTPPPSLKTTPAITVPQINVPSTPQKPDYIYLGGRHVSLDSLRDVVNKITGKNAKENAPKLRMGMRDSLDQETFDSIIERYDELQDLPKPMDQMEEEADTGAAQALPAETADTGAEQMEKEEETDSIMNEHE